MSEGPHFDAIFRQKLLELFRWRRDVRHFRPDAITSDLLDGLIELTSFAPSVGLSQPWRFVTVDDPKRRAAIRANFEMCNAEALSLQPESRAGLYVRLKLAGLDVAPCHVAVFAETEPSQGHRLGRNTMPETVAYSAVIAVHTFWLAARAVGLGVGWVSILDQSTVTAALDVPPGWLLIAYLCVGYPAKEQDIPALEQAGWEHKRPTLRLRR